MAAGVGISAIAELALTQVRDEVVIRSFSGHVPYRRIGAAVLVSAYRSPAASAMLEILQEVAEAHVAARRRRSRPSAEQKADGRRQRRGR